MSLCVERNAVKKNLIVASLISCHKGYRSDALLLNISEEYDDIETVAVNDLAFGIENNEPFLIMSDGARLGAGDPDLPDWAIFHGGPSLFAECLERMGVACFSCSEMANLAKDKIRSALLMSRVFPVPDSLFFPGKIDLCTLPEDKQSFMLKAATGNQGNQVWKVDDPRMVAERERRSPENARLFCQELMPTADDVRVYVLGDEILCAVSRNVPSGVWKSNLSSNPVRQEFRLGADQRKKIGEALSLLPERRGLITLDFLFGKTGEFVFCEMNTASGTNALRTLGREDEIVRKYIAYAREHSR